MTTNSVGTSLLRKDAVAKAMGSATYGVDVRVPGMLVGRMLRAGIPHARIVDIDTSAAERIPGVRAVLTGRDHDRLHGPLVADQPALAIDRVRWEGEAVAAVAAVDDDVAQEALDAIRVEYEPLPVVADVDAALSDGAPVLHEDRSVYRRGDFPGIRLTGEHEPNVGYVFNLLRGDVDEAFAAADVTVEETFRTQFVQYAHLEPHVTVAQFDGTNLTFWTSTMGPHTLRGMLADLMGLPESNVRVVTQMVGGAYGSKMYLRAINPVAALLARHLPNRAVRVVFDREDEFLSCPGRIPAEITLRTAARSDGTLLARDSRIRWNQGAYTDLGPVVCRNSGYVSLGPYRIPNARIHASLVYTNRQPGGPFRGLGVPQMAWAGEQQMDRLADELGMDPLDLRLHNILEEGDETVTGERVERPGAKECLIRAAQALEARQAQPAGPHETVGRGVSVVMKSTLTPTASFGAVKLNPDGSAEVISAAVEHGQGAHTVLAQIVADELAIPVDRVRCVQPDTLVAPYDRGSTSSRTTFTLGNVLRVASGDVRQQLLDIASEVFEARAEDLELTDGHVQVRGAPATAMPYQKVLRTHFRGPGSIVGRGEWSSAGIYDTMDPDTGQSRRASAFWMYGAAAAETAVDEETGQVTVRRLVTAVDAGKAINPLACEQQICGSAVMGYGMTMLEELVFSEGHTLNPTFLDYKIPTTLDLPELETVIVESNDVLGPHGARGVGEVGLAAVPAAIGNSVFAATGVQMTALPLRSIAVREAINTHRAAMADGQEAPQ